MTHEAEDKCQRSDPGGAEGPSPPRWAGAAWPSCRRCSAPLLSRQPPSCISAAGPSGAEMKGWALIRALCCCFVFPPPSLLSPSPAASPPAPGFGCRCPRCAHGGAMAAAPRCLPSWAGRRVWVVWWWFFFFFSPEALLNNSAGSRHLGSPCAAGCLRWRLRRMRAGSPGCRQLAATDRR